MPITAETTIFVRRMASSLAQVRFADPSRHIEVVETTDLPLAATQADVDAWAADRITRFEKALEVYEDANSRIGTVINIGAWRVELMDVTYSLRPLAVTLVLDLYHATQPWRATAEYIVDSLDDYNLATLQAWVIAWRQDKIAQYNAAMAPDPQETLQRVVQ